MEQDRILRLPEVLTRVGFAASTVRALVRTGEFPRPVRLGRRALGWKESSITDWLETRPLR
jgi:prophage regulatory protein